MGANLLCVFLSVVIIVEAFIQRMEDGAASGVVLFGTIAGMLYLISTFLHVILNFERLKFQLTRNRNER